MSQFDIMRILSDAAEAANKFVGHANVLIVGKTGTGKSTLINTIFAGRMAETGQGRPVTQHLRQYKKHGIPITIYDSRGLELDNYQAIIDELKAEVVKKNRQEDPAEHIHVAWLCIAEGSRRVEEGEISLAKMLEDAGIPVIVVITTAVSDQGFKSVVEKEFHMVRNVVRVNSVPLPLDEGAIAPIRGCDILVDLTMQVVPEGQRNAFAAAQRVKLDYKVERAWKAVHIAAAVAGGVGAAPIPFSDAVLIAPTQIGMIASISAVFGIDLETDFIGTVVASLLSSAGASFAGRAIVGGLLKMIPGVGTIAGGATMTIGGAYIHVLVQLMGDNPDRVPTASEVAEALKARLSGMSASETAGEA
jgi:uncharacterized protein (DUF697 family)/GTP-binding protein EngB required for normal cell division